MLFTWRLSHEFFTYALSNRLYKRTLDARSKSCSCDIFQCIFRPRLSFFERRVKRFASCSEKPSGQRRGHSLKTLFVRRARLSSPSPRTCRHRRRLRQRLTRRLVRIKGRGGSDTLSVGTLGGVSCID